MAGGGIPDEMLELEGFENYARFENVIEIEGLGVLLAATMC